MTPELLPALITAAAADQSPLGEYTKLMPAKLWWAGARAGGGRGPGCCVARSWRAQVAAASWEMHVAELPRFSVAGAAWSLPEFWCRQHSAFGSVFGSVELPTAVWLLSPPDQLLPGPCCCSYLLVTGRTWGPAARSPPCRSWLQLPPLHKPRDLHPQPQDTPAGGSGQAPGLAVLDGAIARLHMPVSRRRALRRPCGARRRRHRTPSLAPTQPPLPPPGRRLHRVHGDGQQEQRRRGYPQ
jgi:hypothetical protein